MRQRVWSAAFAAGLALSIAPPASAQYVQFAFTPELYYGVGVGADFIGNNSDLDVCALETSDTGTVNHCQTITELTGGGAALFVGTRLASWFGLQLTYDAFFHQGSGNDPYNLATLQSLRAEARFFLLPGSLIEPYLEAGGGLYLIGDEYGVAKAGGGFQLGAGLDLYLDAELSLGAEALYRGIYFGGFDISQSDLPWASSGGSVKQGFVHDVGVLANLTVHSAY